MSRPARKICSISDDLNKSYVVKDSTVQDNILLVYPLILKARYKGALPAVELSFNYCVSTFALVGNSVFEGNFLDTLMIAQSISVHLSLQLPGGEKDPARPGLSG